MCVTDAAVRGIVEVEAESLISAFSSSIPVKNEVKMYKIVKNTISTKMTQIGLSDSPDTE